MTKPNNQAGLILKSWLIVAGILAVALAMSVGFWNVSELVGAEATSVSLAHRMGRVAGATVIEPGPVNVEIFAGEDPVRYKMTISEELSLFNVLRLLERDSIFESEVDSSGEPVIRSILGVSAGPYEHWEAKLNGTIIDSLDEPVVTPGSSITLRLRRP